MRVKVAQERISDPAQAFGPGFQAGDTVYAETQHLGLDPIEPVENDLVRWDLAGSYWGPGQWEKNQGDIALSPNMA